MPNIDKLIHTDKLAYAKYHIFAFGMRSQNAYL